MSIHQTSARSIPSVDRLLNMPVVQALADRHGHTLVKREARVLLESLRARAKDAALVSSDLDPLRLQNSLAALVRSRVAPRMRSVVNLTGTVIHTNLGRAVLADAAIQHVVSAMRKPSNLEFDLGSGSRGDRDDLIEDLLCQITGAEAATVVNNNAGAVLLAVSALAHGKEVIVSRGELVEIGGAFRMPDVVTSAGARMIEVGTTNRTHRSDYARAIGPETALLLKVHTSNYEVRGFTSAVSESTLAEMARERGIPLVSDLGAGSLVDLSAFGLPKEPTPQQMLKAGCNAVTFSGDKLLGGPQAGLIVGDRELIERIRRSPLKRALRVSKLPLAALEATLQLYLQPERLTTELPTLRVLLRPLESIRAMAAAVRDPMRTALGSGFNVECVDMKSQIGSGSLPSARIPSAGLAISPIERKGTAKKLELLCASLRDLPEPVIGRLSADQLLLDLRCLEDAASLTQHLIALQISLTTKGL